VCGATHTTALCHCSTQCTDCTRRVCVALPTPPHRVTAPHSAQTARDACGCLGSPATLSGGGGEPFVASADAAAEDTGPAFTGLERRSSIRCVKEPVADGCKWEILTNNQLTVANFSVLFERDDSCNPACCVCMLAVEAERNCCLARYRPLLILTLRRMTRSPHFLWDRL
jgi:hypothetical protein